MNAFFSEAAADTVSVGVPLAEPLEPQAARATHITAIVSTRIGTA